MNHMRTARQTAWAGGIKDNGSGGKMLNKLLSSDKQQGEDYKQQSQCVHFLIVVSFDG